MCQPKYPVFHCLPRITITRGCVAACITAQSMPTFLYWALNLWDSPTENVGETLIHFVCFKVRYCVTRVNFMSMTALVLPTRVGLYTPLCISYMGMCSRMELLVQKVHVTGTMNEFLPITLQGIGTNWFSILATSKYSKIILTLEVLLFSVFILWGHFKKFAEKWN